MAVEASMLDDFLNRIGPKLKPVIEGQKKVFLLCSAPEDDQEESLVLAQARQIIETVSGYVMTESLKSEMETTINAWRTAWNGKSCAIDEIPKFHPLGSIVLVSIRGEWEAVYEHSTVKNMRHVHVNDVQELIELVQVEGTVAKEMQWLADFFQVGLYRLSNFLSGLTKVDLRQTLDSIGNAKVTDEIVVELARACPNLVEVDLSGTKVTDYGIKQIATHCRKLKIICLEDTEVTHDGIKAFARACPHIEKMMLSGTSVTVLKKIGLALRLECRSWKRMVKKPFVRTGREEAAGKFHIVKKDTNAELLESNEALLKEDFSNIKTER